MSLSFRPTRTAAVLVGLTLAGVAASTSAVRADDVYLDNGVYVKQLPPWRQRMIQKRMLRQAGVPVGGGSDVVIQGPPAVRVPSPPPARRAMRPMFGGARFPATIIPQDEPILMTRPGAVVEKPGTVIEKRDVIVERPGTVVERPGTVTRTVEPPAPIISNAPVAEADQLDDLPPVDLPPAREVAPARPGTILSTPAVKPQAAPPIELEPEPPLSAPVPAPAAAPTSAPGSGSTPRPKPSA